jgi:site-specific DNA-cytosine methylase
MFRIIQELKPRWVIGENVKGLVNLQDGMVFETVCTDLEGEGYEVRAFNIPAAGVGAPHRRERIWIVAHAKRYNKTDEIGGSDETSRGIQEEHRQDDSSARLTSRTSSIRQTNDGHEDMEDSNNNGHEGGLTETRNQVSSRQESKINGIENTDNSSRRSDGRGDNEQSRVDGEVQRLRDDDKKESTRATGIRGLHERTDISQGAARKDRDQEDDSRTLVQERQSRIQSSIDRGLEQIKPHLKTIKYDNVMTALHSIEWKEEMKMWRTPDAHCNQRTELRKKNEDEVGEGYANQHQRSSSSSESNVANTERTGDRKDSNQQSTTVRRAEDETT